MSRFGSAYDKPPKIGLTSKQLKEFELNRALHKKEITPEEWKKRTEKLTEERVNVVDVRRRRK